MSGLLIMNAIVRSVEKIDTEDGGIRLVVDIPFPCPPPRPSLFHIARARLAYESGELDDRFYIYVAYYNEKYKEYKREMAEICKTHVGNAVVTQLKSDSDIDEDEISLVCL